MLDQIVMYVVLGLSALSTIFVFAETLGFLPPGLSRWLNRNRLTQTFDVLKALGIDVDQIKRRNAAQSVPNYFPDTSDYKGLVARDLERITLEKPLGIGKIDRKPFSGYINLMGATTDPVTAEHYARYITTHLRALLDKGQIESPDFIACPKDGSPILAYEVAKLLEKPLLLHSAQPKFHTAEKVLEAEFDFIGSGPTPQSRALLVDDSTTGGRKVMALIDSLRTHGYKVTDCLIVFEPIGKGAREKLAEKSVRMHSIVEGPKVAAE